jgi:hypothetical protein
MAENLSKIISPNADSEKISKLLRMLMHLDSVMSNAIFDLNNELKGGKVLRQEIKQNLNAIRKKLKTNVKGDWSILEKDEEFYSNYILNAERFENLCYNYFRLGDSMNVNIQISHHIGKQVWTYKDNELVPCLVKRVEIQMVVKDNSGKLEDKSYYVLSVLNKDNKEVGEYIYRGEEDVYKHKKDAKNESI